MYICVCVRSCIYVCVLGSITFASLCDFSIGIVELFRQCGIVELFRQCGIVELFRQCGIVELFRQCGIVSFILLNT